MLNDLSERFELREGGPLLTEADVEAFEVELGARLPNDYRTFILQTNGGIAALELGFQWNGKLYTLPAFCPLLPDSDGGLRRAAQALGDLHVHGYLPIACTLGGLDVCLALSNNPGSVWLACYSYDNEVPVAATMHRLAASFTAFCDELKPIPVVYCPVEELGKSGSIKDLDDYLHQGDSIDALSKNNLSLLCEAIRFRNEPLIDACIKRGAALSKALHMAVSQKWPELIRKLIQKGADVHERDEVGQRPLDYICGTALPGDEGARSREAQELLCADGRRRSSRGE